MALGSTNVAELYAPLVGYTLLVSKLGDLAPVERLEDLLSEVKKRLHQVLHDTPGELEGAVVELKGPAMALVDYLVGHGNLPFSQRWERERPAVGDVGYASADESFANSLCQALENKRGQLLPFYYLAVQLGYGGTLSQTQMEEKKRVLESILFDSKKEKSPSFTRDDDMVFFPTQTERRDFTVPPEESVVIVLVVSTVLALAGIVFTMAKYADATNELQRILNDVVKSAGFGG